MFGRSSTHQDEKNLLLPFGSYPPDTSLALVSSSGFHCGDRSRRDLHGRIETGRTWQVRE
jgi:hypothetical protein